MTINNNASMKGGQKHKDKTRWHLKICTVFASRTLIYHCKYLRFVTPTLSLSTSSDIELGNAPVTSYFRAVCEVKMSSNWKIFDLVTATGWARARAFFLASTSEWELCRLGAELELGLGSPR